jgi:hypothetical protein
MKLRTLSRPAPNIFQLKIFIQTYWFVINLNQILEPFKASTHNCGHLILKLDIDTKKERKMDTSGLGE